MDTSVTDPDRPMMNNDDHQEARLRFILNGLANEVWLPAGQIYQGWVLHEGRWASLGMVQPDVNGNAHLIAEGPELAVPPEAVQATLEPVGGSLAPSGRVVITWQPGP